MRKYKMVAYGLDGLFFFSIVFAAECSGVDILQRIAKVEELQIGCALKNNVLENKIKFLEEKNDALENKLKVHGLKDQHMETSIKTLKEKAESINRIITELTSTNTAPPSIRRRQSETGGVAFSTFLDHDVENLGPEQVIVFNQVQLNAGNGYNKYNGVFTVPIYGVYVFTFFIGERDQNQLYVKLVVNGVTKSDAVAETVSQSHDAQGGNVVVLRVNQGDVVMVEHNTWGSHIEGYPDIRLSTFSGFLLYPLGDVDVSVIGK